MSELERMVDIAEKRLFRIEELKKCICELILLEEESQREMCFSSSRKSKAFRDAGRLLDVRHE